MLRFRAAVAAAVVVGYATSGMAQDSGWDVGQVNATMCYWEQLRGQFATSRTLANNTDMPQQHPSCAIQFTWMAALYGGHRV